MTNLKPIETRYKGYRFRSRLEARWAVFFDALGLKWEYEPEGFELPNGVRYLPDFRVTSPQGVVSWYEIKAPGKAADSKMDALEASMAPSGGESATDLSFVTLEGDPLLVTYENKPRMNICPRCGNIGHHATNTYADLQIFTIECWPCDLNTPCGGDEGEDSSGLAPVTPYKGLLNMVPSEHTAFFLKVNAAAIRARSARFEHGEVG